MATYKDASEAFVQSTVPGIPFQSKAFPVVPAALFKSVDSLLPDLLRCSLEKRLELIEIIICSE